MKSADTNITSEQSNVNTPQTDILLAIHRYLQTQFRSDSNYNPAEDTLLQAYSEGITINIGFIGREFTKTLKLNNGVVEYDKYRTKRNYGEAIKRDNQG